MLPQPQIPLTTPDRLEDDSPLPGTAQPGAIIASEPRENPLEVVPLQPAPPTALAPSPTSLAVAAVIGQTSTIANVPPVDPDQNQEPMIDWYSYAGFAGLLLILGAFCFVAYYRRREWANGQR